VAKSDSMGDFRRRMLTALLAVLPAACVSTGYWPIGSRIAPAPEKSTIRPEAVGQQWVYQVRNVYNGEIVDEVTETIVSTSPAIHIQRISQKWGSLPDEIHVKWGMIIQDSHWDFPITFAKPIPAWPLSFDLGHSATYRNHYQLLADQDASLFWNLTMTPRNWASITVPAGEFTVIHYDSYIHFMSNDLSVVESEREESVWFSPEIGRWVLRRSRGIYYVPGRGGDRYEDYRQWELKSWR